MTAATLSMTDINQETSPTPQASPRRSSRVDAQDAARQSGDVALQIPFAPTYRPTMEQFKNPYKFLASIRKEAQQYGICKIIPPAEWKPSDPANFDWHKNKFDTKLQRINELQTRAPPPSDGKSRNELDEEVIRQETAASATKPSKSTIKSQTEKFTSMRDVPTLESMGRMSTGTSSGTGTDGSEEDADPPTARKTSLRAAATAQLKYDTPLKPSMSATGGDKQQVSSGKRSYNNKRAKLEVLHPEIKIPLKGIPTRKHGRPSKQDMLAYRRQLISHITTNYPHLAKEVEQQTDYILNALNSKKKTQRALQAPTEMAATDVNIDNYELLCCSICDGPSHDDQMLLCDGCDRGFHLFCLTKPLKAIPEGEWLCSDCQAEREHWFGFGTGGEYTLHEYQRYADNFYERYFNSRGVEPTSVTHDDLVREYWRIVETADHTNPVIVKYGSDVDTADFGSGYPKNGSYADDGWNLHNLACLSDSMLSYLDAATISGVTIPWLYVGMVFSSFCWHNEDHYNHSINHIHYGANKQWYGVPASGAAAFERRMTASNPALFQQCPDLLFHLVTMLSPARLTAPTSQTKHDSTDGDDGAIDVSSESVPLYQLVQEEGEIVITFPQSYHAGFNCGMNIAESVNFACNDWLPMGLKCLDRWRAFRRSQCFSQDRLMATVTVKYLQQDEMPNTTNKVTRTRRSSNSSININWESGVWLLPVLQKLRDRERRGREILYKRGVTQFRYWIDAQENDASHAMTTRKARMAMSSHAPPKTTGGSTSVMTDSGENLAAAASGQLACAICKHYLWFSCVRCPCSSKAGAHFGLDKASCLAHAQELCECPPSNKYVEFRYTIDEMNKMVSALEQRVKLAADQRLVGEILAESRAIISAPDEYQRAVQVDDDGLTLLDQEERIEEVSEDQTLPSSATKPKRRRPGKYKDTYSITEVKPYKVATDAC